MAGAPDSDVPVLGVGGGGGGLLSPRGLRPRRLGGSARAPGQSRRVTKCRHAARSCRRDGPRARRRPGSRMSVDAATRGGRACGLAQDFDGDGYRWQSPRNANYVTSTCSRFSIDETAVATVGQFSANIVQRSCAVSKSRCSSAVRADAGCPTWAGLVPPRHASGFAPRTSSLFATHGMRKPVPAPSVFSVVSMAPRHAKRAGRSREVQSMYTVAPISTVPATALIR